MDYHRNMSPYTYVFGTIIFKSLENNLAMYNILFLSVLVIDELTRQI